MKRSLCFFHCMVLLFLTMTAFAQEGIDHKVSRITDQLHVEINIGTNYNVMVGDVFDVFGQGTVIHPATGKLVERDNVFIGKVRITEVKPLTSIAEITEATGKFAAGNKIVKINPVKQEPVVVQKPVRAEFQQPQKTKYSETIYTRQVNSRVPGTSKRWATISKVENQDTLITASLDKGSDWKIRKGVKYPVYYRDKDSSDITGRTRFGKYRYSGYFIPEAVSFDGSTGTLTLDSSNFKPDILTAPSRVLAGHKPFGYSILGINPFGLGGITDHPFLLLGFQFEHWRSYYKVNLGYAMEIERTLFDVAEKYTSWRNGFYISYPGNRKSKGLTVHHAIGIALDFLRWDGFSFSRYISSGNYSGYYTVNTKVPAKLIVAPSLYTAAEFDFGRVILRLPYFRFRLGTELSEYYPSNNYYYTYNNSNEDLHYDIVPSFSLGAGLALKF